MSQNPNDSSCPICFDSLQTNISVVPCRHTFHDTCIRRWVRSSGHQAKCPVCRLQVKEKNIIGPLFASRDASTSVSETAPAQEFQINQLRHENNLLKHQLKKTEHDRSQLESQVIEQQKRIRIFTRLREVTAMDQNLGTPSAQNRMNRWRSLPRDDLCILLGGLHDKLRDSRVKETEARSLVDRLYARINTLKSQHMEKNTTPKNSTENIESSKRRRRLHIPDDEEENDELTSDKRPSKIIHISDDDTIDDRRHESLHVGLPSGQAPPGPAGYSNETREITSLDDDTTDDEREEREERVSGSSGSSSVLNGNSRNSQNSLRGEHLFVEQLSDDEEGFEDIPTISHFRNVPVKRTNVRPLDSSYQTPLRLNAIVISSDDE